MRKFLTVIILFICITAGFTQNIAKGIVKDGQTGRVLEVVTISTPDFKFNTISNREGAFKLAFPEGTKKIVFKYLGYAPLEVSLSNLPADNVYYLQPKSIQMDVIMIMNTPVQEFLKDLVENSKAKLTSPLLLSGYYREFINFNNNYVKFADGLLGYNLHKNGKKIKTELLVRQSRAKQLATYKEGMVQAVGVDVRKTAVIDCNFEILEKIFFSGKGYKNYDYVFKSKESEDSESIATITFTPKAGLMKELFEGTITYNPDTNIIMGINAKKAEGQNSKERNFLFLAHYQLLDVNYKSVFRMVDGQYSLAYSTLYESIRIWSKNTYDNTYAFKNDLIISNTLPGIADLDRTDKYDERSLYERGSNYTDKFWEGNNAIPLTTEEEAIIKSMERPPAKP